MPSLNAQQMLLKSSVVHSTKIAQRIALIGLHLYLKDGSTEVFMMHAKSVHC